MPNEDPAADAALLERLRHLWLWCQASEPAEAKQAITIGQSPDCDINTGNIATTLNTVSALVTRELISAQTGKLMMAHACGLSHPDTGDSIIFVAKGGTGKTTIAQRFGSQFGYLSDETIGFTADRRIHPYPKPLSVRVADSVKVEKSPQELGLIRPHTAPVLKQIVVLERVSTATALQVTNLSTLDAIQALANQTSSLSLFPDSLQQLAQVIEATAGVQHWRYWDVAQLGDRLRAALEASS